MTTAFLYLNAAIYFAFSLWCTLAASTTAQSLGFLSMSPSGKAEYLTVYGGLQMGLAIIFGWTAWSGELRFGLIVAMALYAPLVLWRVGALSVHGPLAPVTLYVAGLELAMLIVAGVLWLNQTRTA